MAKPFAWIRETPDAGTMKPADRYSLWGVVVVLVALLVLNVIASAQRIVDVVAGPPLDVELLVDAQIPTLDAVATSATFTVTWLDGTERAWLLVEPIAGTLAWAAMIASLSAFLATVALRRPFTARLPLLLATGGMIYLVLQSVSLFAHGAGTSAIAHRLDLDYYAVDIDFLRIFVLPIVLITVAYVLGAGRRIQKDTEGLV